MLDKLEYFLLQAGYGMLQTSGKESTVYFQSQGQFTSVIHLLSIPEGLMLAPEQYLQIKQELITRFEAMNLCEVHILTMVLTEYVPILQETVKEDSFAWMIDRRNKCLVIQEGHVEDFYGMKRIVLSSLEEGNSYGFTEDELQRGKKKSFQNQPFINYGIVALNILIFLICMLDQSLLYQNAMLFPKGVVEDGKWYQLVTSMFLHADVDHIFGNMMLLYLLGNIAEKYLGHTKYLIMYIGSGIAGNFLSILYSYVQAEFVPSLGASGAVYGTVGAFLWILLCHRGKVEEITLPRYLFVFAYSLYLGFTSTNVNNVAHVGGLLAGCLLGILLYRKSLPDSAES